MHCTLHLTARYKVKEDRKPDGKRSHRLLHLDHIEADGCALYRLACGRNLAGIVAKHRDAPYDTRRALWVKIKTPTSPQVERERSFWLPQWHFSGKAVIRPLRARCARKVCRTLPQGAAW